MGEKKILRKNYARDFSLALEQTWLKEFKKNMAELYGYKSPHEPYVVLHATSENLEIWEHDKAVSHFQDWLLEKNRAGIEFMSGVIQEYRSVLARAEGYWSNGATANVETIRAYLHDSLNIFTLFCLWYYTCIDERTPEEVQKLVYPLREKDELFAKSDKFIKDCIEAMSGNRALANLILAPEFPDNLPSEEVLRSRASGVVAVDDEPAIFSPLLEFAAAHPEHIFEDLHTSVEGITEIKGQVAYKGRASGTVRIVKNVRSLDNVKEGDILVSPMTTPDFLSAMKRAAAFVTDEGGVMCHGAIVAREMHKPCIIGTKVATKVLHDGDLVEVDAERGVVTIIKK